MPLLSIAAGAWVVAVVVAWPASLRADAEADFEQLADKFDEQTDAGQYRAAAKTVEQMQRLARGPLRNQPNFLAHATHEEAYLFYQQDRLEEAEAGFKRAVEIWEKSLGEGAALTVNALENLANVYFDLQRGPELEKVCKRLLSIGKNQAADDETIAGYLNHLGVAYEYQERYGEAEATHKRSLAMRIEALGPHHIDVAASYYNLADTCYYQQRYAEAEAYYRQNLDILQRAQEPDEAAIAETLYDVASACFEQEHYDEAETFYKQSLEMTRKVCGEEHQEVALVLNDLGVLYLEQSRYAEAAPLFERAVAIVKKTLGPTDFYVGLGQSNLGTAYMQLSRYDEAQPLCEQALSILEKHAEDSPENLADCLTTLASIHSFRGHYEQSERLYKRALELQKKASGPEDADVAFTMNLLGALYRDQGKFAEAERLAEQALAIAEKALGPNHANVATQLQDLGALYLFQGRFAEAEQLFKRALIIEEGRVGPQHVDVSWPLLNLLNVYYALGRYAEAEPLGERALAVREQALGPDHHDVADTLNDLANVYGDQGRYAEAEPLYKRAYEIYRKKLGDEGPDVAMALGNLADMYCQAKRLAEAEPLSRRALAIYEKALGPDSIDTAYARHVLANVCRDLGRRDEAKRLYLQARDNYERVLGPDHPGVCLLLTDLAKLYEAQGLHAEAEPLLDRAIAIHDRAGLNTGYESLLVRARIAWKLDRRSEAVADLRRAMQLAESLRAQSSGAEHERAKAFGEFREAFELMVAWQIELGDLNEALAAMERARARSLLDEMFMAGSDLYAGRPILEREQLKRRENDLKRQIASLRKQLQLLQTAGDAAGKDPGKKTESLQAELARARAELYDYYRDQRNSSPVYRNLLSTGAGPPRLSQLQRRLVQPDGLLLVYMLGEKAGYLLVVGPQNAAMASLTVSRADAGVLGVEPGPLSGDRLKQALIGRQGASLVQQLRDPQRATQATDRLAVLWRVLVPEPQREALTDGTVKRLIVVPDGHLVLLPLETLVVRPGTNPSYLLDEGPPVQYAPSVTVLYNLSERRPPPGDSGREPVLTVGNPRYSGPSAPPTTAPGSALSQLAARSRYTALGGKLEELPYSGQETGWVVDVFGDYGIQAAQLVRNQATEANVRAQVSGRRIVHLACHGLVDQSYGNFYGALALAPGKDEHDPADDGLLTLAEIYQLDLQGTELAILSACDTNFGPQQRGEGVWALSRGFLVAGARRVVASNWLVDDEAAASLVSYFCSSVAKAEKEHGAADYATALHKAKRWARKKDKWRSPYYWGTFVLVGPN